MKIVKILLIVFLSLFLIFFVTSFLTPSEYKTEVIVKVDASIEKSFKVFTDETKMAEWITGFVSVENLTGENNAVGSTYKIVMNDEGREIIMTETITAFKENEYFAFDMENDDVFTAVDISFTPIDSSQTEIKAKSLFIPKAMFIKVLMPLFEEEMHKRQDSNYLKLKKVIESEIDSITNNDESLN